MNSTTAVIMKPPQPPKSNWRYAQRSNTPFPRGRTTQCSPLKPLFSAGARRWSFGRILVCLLLGLAAPAATLGAENQPPPGFVTLFNGRDLSGWTVPEGDNGHWKVLDGVIDYDAVEHFPMPVIPLGHCPAGKIAAIEQRDKTGRRLVFRAEGCRWRSEAQQ